MTNALCWADVLRAEIEEANARCRHLETRLAYHLQLRALRESERALGETSREAREESSRKTVEDFIATMRVTR